MNNIITYNSDFQRYKEHYNALKDVKDTINSSDLETSFSLLCSSAAKECSQTFRALDTN